MAALTRILEVHTPGPWFSRVLLLLLLCCLLPAQAEDAPVTDPVPGTRVVLDRLERKLAAEDAVTRTELRGYRDEIASVRTAMRDCIEQAERQIGRLEQELAILRPEKPAADTAEGKPAAGAKPDAPVSPAIARQVKELQTRKAGQDERLANCRLVLLRADELDSDIDGSLRSLQTRQLLVRGPGVVEILRENLENPQRWLDFTARLAVSSTGWQVIRPVHLGGAAAVGVLGFLLGYFVPRRLRDRSARLRVEEEEVSGGMLQALIACSVRYAPAVLALAAISTYLSLVPRADGDLPFAINLVHGLLAYLLVAAGIRMLLNPCPPAPHYLPLAQEVAVPLSRRGRVLALVLLAWWLAAELFAEQSHDASMFLLVRHVLGVFWVLNLVWMIWLLRRVEGWRDRWALPLLLGLALAGGLVAGWIGYANLGRLVVLGITSTLVLLGLAIVASQFFSDLFDGLDEGRYRWQQRLRGLIGLKGEEHVPGLGWLRLLVNLAIWTGAVLLVLYTWDAGEEITADTLRLINEGFHVGGMTIVPGQLLWAILVLALLLTLTRWFKARLNSKWLLKTRMERSAREAMVTTFGYVAAAISIIIALSIAGIDFSNLAIIAGALSVGIGFGLQNVVNNFISGLIMLVERPVRTGDWIVVGGTEGHVKRISIRTTSIETFDRAEVIVPNSDLISGQLTNWTLRSQWGRIRVPVGVAYGSDTSRVKGILLGIGNDHPDVIKGSAQLPDPSVLFIGFGASSLDFELRGIVRNVDRRLGVISDINFAIDAAFREHGIEIPFPQRDVNFRNPLQLGGDAGERGPGGEDGTSAPG